MLQTYVGAGPVPALAHSLSPVGDLPVAPEILRLSSASACRSDFLEELARGFRDGLHTSCFCRAGETTAYRYPDGSGGDPVRDVVEIDASGRQKVCLGQRAA